MKVLLDTNVVFDVMLPRPAWAESAAGLWDASENGRLDCFITATTLTTIYYVARKEKGVEFARLIVRTCLDELDILPVDANVLEVAHQRKGIDFEDDLQIACAVAHSLDAIVTRDKSGGFDQSPMKIYTPETLTEYLRSNPEPPPKLEPPPPFTTRERGRRALGWF